MTAFRTETSTDFTFTFDGLTVVARQGDTIASALLASNIAIIGRSFKYHRPRGLQAAHVEEPNAIVDVTIDGRTTSNIRATLELARPGMVVKSVNSDPDARRDRFSFIDHFSRFIPAAFYYKTFMFPDWHRFEPKIRDMAGLGRVDPDWRSNGPATHREAHVDVLVVGAGPAGLSAAMALIGSGKSVMLVDDRDSPGGSLAWRDLSAKVNGKPVADWVADSITTLRKSGVTILPATTAFGLYDHNLVALCQRHGDKRPDTMWRLRTGHVIAATGAIERPLPFANNDRPMILLADAMLAYLKRFGVVAGRRIVIGTNNDSTCEVAAELAAAGAKVTLVDCRPDTTAPTGVTLVAGRRIVEAKGKEQVNGVLLDDGTALSCDALGMSGGFTPTIHLYGQARGKLRFDDTLQAFVPGNPVDGLTMAGSANGAITLYAALMDGQAAAARAGNTSVIAYDIDHAADRYTVSPAWPQPGQKGRVWIDFQNDVTAKDVELAARENFVSVEHLKRYTTLGMANDQGKTSNMNGLALMGQLTGRSIPEVGTTTYRPPFIPISLQTMTGRRSGLNFNPVKRLPLDAVHRADKATFMESGGWLRPAYYGNGEEKATIAAEALAARNSVGLFDGSTLGKIEVIGPKAAEFLDFIFYNTISTLKPGKCRYGFILTETGMVYDDGVVVRLSDNHFIVSCSSSHVAGVHGLLEDWRQDRFDVNQVFIHNATPAYATLTVTGPNSRNLLATMGLGIDLSDEALPHMAFAIGAFAGSPLRVARVSFTGDRSYELTIAADKAESLWAALRHAGKRFEASLLGLEALVILRAEKGYIIIGKDTDGLTRPTDLGLDAPLRNKKVEFIGRRSLLTEDAKADDPKQLIGLEVIDGRGPLDMGAHGVEKRDGKWHSLGYVTSAYMSPILGKPIAMGLIERGFSRQGDIIDIRHFGDIRKARITSVCAFDPTGGRLNA